MAPFNSTGYHLSGSSIMQVSVEKINSVERRLTITVPAEQITAAYAKHIDMYASKANIKGFRPGKAPMALIQQRFGEEARKDAIGEVIELSLYQAIDQNKLKPISSPRVQPKVMLADQPLEFTATFEVLPEVESVNFKMDNIEKPIVEIKDEDLTRVLTQLQKQYTKWEAVDRAAAKGDRLVIDYYAKFEGNSDANEKMQNRPIELGSDMMMPGFEDGLIGAKAGEERTLNLTIPQNEANKENGGKPIEFVVTVKQVMAANTPALDEKLVKQLGVKSGDVADLQKQIRQSLEQERDRLVSEKLKEQVFTLLLEQNPLEIPASLIEREAKSIHDEVHPHHHDHHAHSHEEMAMFNDVAKKRVALSLLISEYTKQEKVTVDPARVTARIAEIASAYENPQEVVEWLNTEERRRGVTSQVAEDMVLEKFMSGVPVTEKVMTYAELKGINI